jgi:hypothetical protein
VKAHQSRVHRKSFGHHGRQPWQTGYHRSMAGLEDVMLLETEQLCI